MSIKISLLTGMMMFRFLIGLKKKERKRNPREYMKKKNINISSMIKVMMFKLRVNTEKLRRMKMEKRRVNLVLKNKILWFIAVLLNKLISYPRSTR